MTDSLGRSYFVRDGVEVSEHIPDRGQVGLGMFDNRLTRASLERIGRIVEAARSLDASLTTSDFIALADARADPKGALGALRMLDVSGVVFATAAGRKQLLWNPGARPYELDPPRAARLYPAEYARDGLQRTSGTWIATDVIVHRASYDPTMPYWLGELDETTRALRRLPASMFADHSKHGRRQALGALKALYWLGDVAFTYLTQQAVAWTWIGAEGRGWSLDSWVARDSPPRFDPYLSDGIDPHERRSRNASERMERYIESRQVWIDERYPKLAAQWRERQAERHRRLRSSGVVDP